MVEIGNAQEHLHDSFVFVRFGDDIAFFYYRSTLINRHYIHTTLSLRSQNMKTQVNM